MRGFVPGPKRSAARQKHDLCSTLMDSHPPGRWLQSVNAGRLKPIRNGVGHELRMAGNDVMTGISHQTECRIFVALGKILGVIRGRYPLPAVHCFRRQ